MFEEGWKIGSDEGFEEGSRDEFWFHQEQLKETDKCHLKALEQCKLAALMEGKDIGQKEECLCWISDGHGDMCKLHANADVNFVVQMNTSSKHSLSLTPPSAKVKWSDEPSQLLVEPIFTTTASHGPCDLLALHSRLTKPFATLQCCIQRSCTACQQ